MPGVIFNATDSRPSSPFDVSENAIHFSYKDSRYMFTSPACSANRGSLAIEMDSSIPANQVSVGIGMSGSPAFAVNAVPNFTFSFTSQPEYWVTFGDFNEGEALDLNTLDQTMQVVFQEHVYSRKIMFNADNTWSDEQ